MLTFDKYITECVVKVLAPNGDITGTAFWVLPEYCLTCYHVLPRSGMFTQKIEKVSVNYQDRELTADFRPELSNPDGDIAVLHVNGFTGQSVPLGPAEEPTLGVEVRAFGFRKGFPWGYSVTGRLRPGQKTDKGDVYNWETGQPDRSSIQGMSGCPVFDSRRLLVIGLTYGEEEEGPAVSYIHPLKKIYDRWEDLPQQNLAISRRVFAELMHPYLTRVLTEASGALDRQSFIARNAAPVEAKLVRYIPSPQRGSGEESGEAESLDAFWGQGKKLLLLGEAGLGKSTSLLNIALAASERAIAEPQNAEIPIHVELKNYQGEPELEVLMAHRINQSLKNAGQPELADDASESLRTLKAWLKRPGSSFLLILDGLNEVAPQFQTQIREGLRSLLSYRHTIVISCRERDYDGSLGKDITAVSLRPLSEAQILNYFDQRFGRSRIHLFEQHIIADERMRTLAGNPLMLSLIGTMIGEQDAHLAPKRGQLLQGFVKSMPTLCLRESHSSSAKPDLVETALETLAFRMQEQGLLHAELRVVRRWAIPVDGHRLDEVLDRAREWRFLKSVGEHIEFIHPLFQDYFASAYLRRQLEEYRDYDYRSAIGKRWSEDRWHSSMLMLAETYHDPERLFLWLSKRVVGKEAGRKALLAYDCWATSKAPGSFAWPIQPVDVYRGVEKILGIAVKDPDESVQRGAVYRVIEFYDMQAVDPLLVALEEGSEADICTAAEHTLRTLRNQRNRTGDAVIMALPLGFFGGSMAVDAMIKALHNEQRVGVREVAAKTLGELGDVGAIDAVVAALQDPKPSVRKAAAKALGDIGGRDFPIGALTALLQQEPEPEVRQAAVEALGKREFNEQVVDPLLNALQKDPSAVIRFAAVESLASSLNLSRRPVIESLITTLETDPVPNVRGVAAWALGFLFPKDPSYRNAVDALLAALSKNPDRDVQRQLAASLAELGDSCALTPLEELEKKTTDPTVANDVREAIAKLRRIDASRKSGEKTDTSIQN